jgi:hypothetical protein
MSVDARTRLVRKDDVVERSIEDGAVLVDMTSGRCWELNRLGVEVWSLLSNGQDLQGICDLLAGRYSVVPATLMSDVIDLARTLLTAQLVDLRPEIDPSDSRDGKSIR